MLLYRFLETATGKDLTGKTKTTTKCTFRCNLFCNYKERNINKKGMPKGADYGSVA